MSTETQKVDVLAVMDTDARAIALVADDCVGTRKQQWECHLAVHDYARDAVAELIESITVLSSYCDVTVMDPENEEFCATLSSHWRRVENALARVGGAT